MLNYADIQIAYNKLYTEIRRYIWSFEAVCALADLEIACYKTCPDLDEVKNAFYTFKLYAQQLFSEDEELESVFDNFEDIMNSDDTTYAKLNKVEEVVTNENNI